jgi:hypothetical protein
MLIGIYLGAKNSNPISPLNKLKKRKPLTGFIDIKRTNKDPTVSPNSPIESRIPMSENNNT